MHGGAFQRSRNAYQEPLLEFESFPRSKGLLEPPISPLIVGSSAMAGNFGGIAVLDLEPRPAAWMRGQVRKGDVRDPASELGIPCTARCSISPNALPQFGRKDEQGEGN